MTEMQQGRLFLRVKQKAQNQTLGSLLVAGLAGAFISVGANMLSEGEVTLVPFVIITILASLFLVGALLVAYVNIRVWRDPSRSEAFTALSRFGEPRDLVVAIELEMHGETERFGPALFTEHWLICSGGDGDMHFVRADELLEVRKRVKIRRAKGVVKVGEDHFIKLKTSHEEFEMKVPHAHSENVLLCIRQRVAPGQVEYFLP